MFLDLSIASYRDHSLRSNWFPKYTASRSILGGTQGRNCGLYCQKNLLSVPVSGPHMVPGLRIHDA